MNKNFICEICNLIFKSKYGLDKHKNKKNKCNVETEYQCNQCNKYFTYNKTLKRHQLTCTKINKNNESLEDVNEESEIEIIINSNTTDEKKINLLMKITKLLKDDINDVLEMDISNDKKAKLLNKIVKETPTGTINNITANSNNTNSNNNITNNILINNFGQENLSYMDNDYFKNLIMNQHIEKGYVQLIKDIYLNKDHPENKTVKVENINNKYAHVYNSGKWEAILKADLKEQLHKKNYTILKMHYDKLKKTMTIPKKEETFTFLKRDDFSDPHMMYVIDKIILLFYNDGDGEDLLEKSKINKNII